MTRRILAPICVLFLLIFPLRACNHTSVRSYGASYSNAQLRRVVEEYLDGKTNILGTIVKVDIEGTHSFEAANGYIDSSMTIPIKPTTKFAVGSITKIFTAVLVHQLIEKGRVDPRRPLIHYLSPDWSGVLDDIEHGADITVEQALSHRSGLADMTESEAFWKSLFFDSTAAWTPLDILKMVRQKREAKFEPGEDYDYCNTNYILLGGLIEHVSGMSYGESLQENILDRIGLRNTFLVEETIGAHDGTIAHGYSRVEDVLYDGHEFNVGWTRSTGGIVSNAGDLVTFCRALVAGDLFDDPGTYERICLPVGYNESYGQGLEIVDDPDVGLYYGHKGSLLNTRSILAYFPEHRMTVTVCHTYDSFSMAFPADLVKSVVQSVTSAPSAGDAEHEFEGPDILADHSNVVDNADAPVHGEWNFDLKEQWSLNELDGQPLLHVGDIRVDEDGSLYVVNLGTSEIAVLDPHGNLLRSFGGSGDGPRFGYPLDLFVTPDYIHVLDMGNTGNKIKTYDKDGKYVKATDIEAGVSPRTFVDANQYIAVRSSSDVLNRPDNELLELIYLGKKKGSVLAQFTAEDKLILEIMLPMARYILLEDDINIFPRLIVHYDGNMLYLGRSDEYVIKKFDLGGAEQLAFGITGREREALPPDYVTNLAGRTRVAGKDMPEETKERYLARFPEKLTSYTNIATDEQGLIYVYVSGIMNPQEQEIDIFSPNGIYLYHAVIEIPGGFERKGPVVLDGNCLYALVKTKDRGIRIVKFGVTTPVR